MSDPAEIYLQPECCSDPGTGRLWCEHDAPEECEDGTAWTRYVRGDLHETLHIEYVSLQRDISRHVAICAEQAGEIERLREWITDEGLRSYTCTFNILKEVCGNCECKRKPKAAIATKGDE